MTRKEALKRALKELVEARNNLRNGQKNGVPPDQLAALREKVEYRETVVEVLRPATIDREAWGPCYFCKIEQCFNCKHDDLSIISEPCNSCVGDKWVPKYKFCPECGRPFAPEAWAILEKRLRG